MPNFSVFIGRMMKESVVPSGSFSTPGQKQTGSNGFLTKIYNSFIDILRLIKHDIRNMVLRPRQEPHSVKSKSRCLI